MKRPHQQRRSQRLDPDTATIAIIGSGLAGLSTAVSLEQAGFRDIHIYERDASLDHRREGYGLTLTYNPSGILNQLGVLDEIAAADCPSRSHYMFASTGEIKGYFGNGFTSRGWGQRGNLRVPRQVVRRILMDSLQHTKVHWGYKFCSINEVANATTKSGDASDEEKVHLTFQKENDGGSDDTLHHASVDLVVAADGIRSAVARAWLPQAPAPQSVGIRLIVGLTENYTHPLLHERGFYTLAQGVRLFLMPYAGCGSLDPDKPVRYMWQLSFHSERYQGQQDSNATATSAISLPEQLRQQALEISQNWHEPVRSMILQTPAETIWSTELCDRDPAALYEHLLQKNCQRVILTGDSLHAMTVFKGQGANQALQDGAVVAKWLLKASLKSAVRGCMREMVQRTAPVVEASREAARYWHSPQALEQKHKFAGFGEKEEGASCCSVDVLLWTLKDRGVTADTANLDERVRQIITELSVGKADNKNNDDVRSVDASVVDDDKSKFLLALKAAEKGAMGDLRRLSWRQPGLLRCFSQVSTGYTVLHVAVIYGHMRVVHWLVTEAGCSVTAKDASGKTAIELSKDPLVKDLLHRIQNNESMVM